jgi:hypothetical protein
LCFRFLYPPPPPPPTPRAPGQGPRSPGTRQTGTAPPAGPRALKGSKRAGTSSHQPPDAAPAPARPRVAGRPTALLRCWHGCATGLRCLVHAQRLKHLGVLVPLGFAPGLQLALCSRCRDPRRGDVLRHLAVAVLVLVVGGLHPARPTQRGLPARGLAAAFVHAAAAITAATNPSSAASRHASKLCWADLRT